VSSNDGVVEAAIVFDGGESSGGHTPGHKRAGLGELSNKFASLLWMS